MRSHAGARRLIAHEVCLCVRLEVGCEALVCVCAALVAVLTLRPLRITYWLQMFMRPE